MNGSKVYAVCDGRIPKAAANALEKHGFELILLPMCQRLSQTVAGHPDMLIFPCDKLICHSEYYSSAKATLDSIAAKLGVCVELSNEEYSDKYPDDVLFNAVTVGSRIYCREKSISSLVIGYAERKHLSVINVRQGYTKCSVCTVSENAVITSDRGIAKAMKSNCVDVLVIGDEGVLLNGVDHGFIGGASGGYGNRIYFCGNIESHPDGERIADFCKRHGKTAVSLSSEPLYDIGSIFFV